MDGKIIFEGEPLPEGTVVTILAREADETFEVPPELEAELLESIAEAEKIEATDEDLQAEIARLAAESGMPLAKLQQQLRGGDAREALKHKIKEDKAVSVLSSAATIQNA